MKNYFTKSGFAWIPWSEVGNVSNMQRGDIILCEHAHTELYLGNGKFVVSSDDYDNKSGDSNGKEIWIRGFWDRGDWDGILRYQENYVRIPDLEQPIISNIMFSHVTNDSFRVEIDVTDNVGVNRVRVPVWSLDKGQDDLIWYDAVKYTENHWYCDVSVQEHGNNTGKYIIDTYAYDAGGNSAYLRSDITLEKSYPIISNVTTTTSTITTQKTTTTTTSSEATTTTTLPDKYKSTLTYENEEDSPLYYIPEESSGYNIKAEVEVEGPKKLDETDSADSSIINAIRSCLTSSFEKALKAIGDPEKFAEKTEQIAEEAVKSFNEISDTGYTATKIEIADISKSDKGDLKYTLGDLNDDGAVDGTDATIVLREFGNILAGKGESFTPEQVAAGDVDRNGVIDGSDVTIILKFYGEAGNDIEISYAGMVPWMEKNYWNR